MKFSELAKERYSVRKFKEEPIAEEHLKAILEAGQVAPTACNYQPQKIYGVRDAERLQELAGVCRCTFGAPTILVIGYDRNVAWKNVYNGGYGRYRTQIRGRDVEGNCQAGGCCHRHR